MRIVYFLGATLWASLSYGQSEPTFAQLPASLDAEQQLPLSNTVQFDVHVKKPDAFSALLSDWQGIQTLSISETTLRIAMSAGTISISQASAAPGYRKSSFVIDFDEPAVQAVVKQYLELHPPSDESEPNVFDIEHFISSYIDEPSYIHDFAFASTVAKSKSGDCTEFAVLVVALARALGLPARVIMGTVIVEGDDSIEAYGHAWGEVWRGEKWHRVDAALAKSNAKRRFYLPSHVLQNEGPGYALPLLKSVYNMPTAITGLKVFE
ncbi:hypothetical protein D210916BOD24_07600 [Alteromonas sp. D210916BOD_24]|uniref:transglutaminase-like domain-containing protein n=1 Tax=Alteromonas sp. D210916BOD_24 TaxID=3157618 RepID=UPI00399C8E21